MSIESSLLTTVRRLLFFCDGKQSGSGSWLYQYEDMSYIEDDLADQVLVREILIAQIQVSCGIQHVSQAALLDSASVGSQKISPTNVSDLSECCWRFVEEVFRQNSLEDLVCGIER